MNFILLSIFYFKVGMVRFIVSLILNFIYTYLIPPTNVALKKIVIAQLFLGVTRRIK